jgi:MoxR-like ATPase
MSTTTPTPTDFTAARETYRKISDNMAKIMRGQSAATRHLLAAMAAGGHVLLEDYPGTGKTTLAKALAKSTRTSHTFCRNRIYRIAKAAFTERRCQD